MLRDVSFELFAGEVLVIIGPNGAGKTTLLEAVTGIGPVDSGSVFHCQPGRARKLDGLLDFAHVFSFLLDEAELPEEVSVRTLLTHAAKTSRAPATLADSLRTALDLDALLDARGRELSRGERRRVALFAALCTTRPVVVLDEPLGVFDPRQQRKIVQLLKDRARTGTALLLSVHQMTDAEKLADRILLLSEGRALACGTFDALRQQAGCPGASLEEVFLALLSENDGCRHAAP